MNNVKDKQREFLLSNGSHTIKNLMYREYMDTSDDKFRKNLKELLVLPSISYWRNCLPNHLDLQSVLGSNDKCFENSFGKLLAFGLSADEILNNALFRECMDFVSMDDCKSIYDPLARQIIVSYLVASGKINKKITDIVQKRIELLYKTITITAPDYNIYVEENENNIPSQYRGKKLIDEKLYLNNELALPLIHDIFLLSYYYDFATVQYKRKIDAIIDYVVDEKYQSLDYGYGMVIIDKRKFHNVGWSAHLPYYNDPQSTKYFMQGLVHRMMLFSRFNNESVRCWINNVLEHIKKYRIDDFRYCLPTELLPEIKNSYYMHGRHTGLNENRRTKLGRIIESTYYIHMITKNLERQ